MHLNIYRKENINISFRDLERSEMKQTKQLINFLHRQKLDYPNYDKWLEKSINELNVGTKNALIGYCAREVAGDIVWQFHKTIPSMIELKNIRISEKVRERYFATFMLKQVEWQVQKVAAGMIVDCRESHRQMRDFLMKNNFIPFVILSLYEETKKDICLVKFFDQKRDLAEITSYFAR